MSDPYVQWKAPYASQALNRKFANLIPRGAHAGYWVSVAGADTIDVDANRPDGGTDPANVALVDRDAYQLTVRDENPQTLTVPSPDGIYHAVVEAEYVIGQTTVAQLKIVADGNEAPHHIIVGSVQRSGGSLTALPEQYRMEPVWPLSSTGAVKTADESVVNSATLQDDDDLAIDLRGGTTYIFRAVLLLTDQRPLSQGTGGGIKFQLVAGGGASIGWGYQTHPDLNESAPVAGVRAEVGLDASDEITATFGSDNDSLHPAMLFIHGVIETTTEGSVKLQWAQSNADGDALTVHKGSHMRVIDVSS